MTYIHFALTDSLSQPSALDLFHFIKQEQTQLDHAILSSNLNDISCFPTHIYLQTHSNHSGTAAEQIEECLKAVSMHMNQRTLMTSLLLSSNLCMILALLSHSTIQTINSNIQLHNIPEIPPKLKLAINYIVNHYSEQITLDALAQHCHVSKQQLIRYFNVAFHTTPINYVTDFKLSRAKELLFNHPEISVKEIAAELGFDNQHYFSRVFKSKNGETPSEYRTRIFNYLDTEI